MLKPVTSAARSTRLADMGVVRAIGADAVKFLQGQVSNDVTRLAADRSVLAGLHNAQGRAIAVLRMVLAGPEEILMVVPRELAAVVASRRSKFVLRAKVKIADASSEWEVTGIADGLAGVPVGETRYDDENRPWVCVGPARWFVLSRSVQPYVDAGDAISTDEWRGLDIADGQPQVFAATSEAFVAQMLNLDVLDGIAFDKGCYTGQEVIARAHYRGRVKRRVRRGGARRPGRRAPGEAGRGAGGRAGK